jgi:hypothetical protein
MDNQIVDVLNVYPIYSIDRALKSVRVNWSLRGRDVATQMTRNGCPSATGTLLACENGDSIQVEFGRTPGRYDFHGGLDRRPVEIERMIPLSRGRGFGPMLYFAGNCGSRGPGLGLVLNPLSRA